VGLGFLAVDVWAIWFWAGVGGSLGGALAVVETVVALLLGALLLIEARRQCRLSGRVDDQPPE